MIDTGENTRVINIDSVIILAVIFFGLFFYIGDHGNSKSTAGNMVPPAAMISQKYGVVSSPLRIQVFQETNLSDKDHFSIAGFKVNPVYENIKSDITISLLKEIRLNSFYVPRYFFLYHLFPPDKDEPPFIS